LPFFFFLGRLLCDKFGGILPKAMAPLPLGFFPDDCLFFWKFCRRFRHSCSWVLDGQPKTTPENPPVFWRAIFLGLPPFQLKLSLPLSCTFSLKPHFFPGWGLSASIPFFSGKKVCHDRRELKEYSFVPPLPKSPFPILCTPFWGRSYSPVLIISSSGLPATLELSLFIFLFPANFFVSDQLPKPFAVMLIAFGFCLLDTSSRYLGCQPIWSCLVVSL